VEWLVAIYLIVGVFKTLRRMGNPNPALKPAWLLGERNLLTVALYFTINVLTWPFLRG